MRSTAKTKETKPAVLPANDGPAVDGVRQSRLEKRRRALIEAATTEFLAKGYEGATLTDIIARAGGSRSTIYKEFGNKADLYKAIGMARAEGLLKVLNELWSQEGNAREALGRYARAYVRAILEPDTIRLHRSGLTESAQFPELARAFFDAHARAISKPIADYLRHLDETGELRVPDPDMAAKMYLVMVKGSFQLQTMVEPGRRIGEAEIDAHIAFAVDLFVNGLKNGG